MNGLWQGFRKFIEVNDGVVGSPEMIRIFFLLMVDLIYAKVVKTRKGDFIFHPF
jgi:hypothetical protein